MTEQERNGQRREALARANQIRCARAELKRKLKRGEVRPQQLLATVPQEMAEVPLAEFLTFLPRVGRYKASVMAKQVMGTPTVPSIKLGRMPGPTRERAIRIVDSFLLSRSIRSEEYHQAALAA